MFANKSLSDFGIPVILSTIYVPKEKIGNMKYIHHRKRGIKVPLLIRELKADRITVGAGAYTFLGTANYVKHDGSRPIWDQDKFMICQRPAHKARGLLWEFVGGKVEPGETKEQALIRECMEELAVTLNVGDIFMDVIHEYSDLTVHLTLFNALIQSGIPQKLEHNDIQWITVDEIDQYDFCPADEEILTRLKTIK